MIRLFCFFFVFLLLIDVAPLEAQETARATMTIRARVVEAQTATFEPSHASGPAVGPRQAAAPQRAQAPSQNSGTGQAGRLVVHGRRGQQMLVAVSRRQKAFATAAPRERRRAASLASAQHVTIGPEGSAQVSLLTDRSASENGRSPDTLVISYEI